MSDPTGRDACVDEHQRMLVLLERDFTGHAVWKLRFKGGIIELYDLPTLTKKVPVVNRS